MLTAVVVAVLALASAVIRLVAELVKLGAEREARTQKRRVAARRACTCKKCDH